jgi:hypothetical protein
MNLIPGSKLTNCPLSPSPCTDQYTLNTTAVATAAQSADSTGQVPVTLDLEQWDADRFQPTGPIGTGPSIVANLNLAISTFKQSNPTAKVGLFAEVPQNTLGATTGFDSLNRQYASVAALVDYYYPVVYNVGYDGTATGDNNWISQLQYNMQQIKNYFPAKKTYPYITPGWTDTSSVFHLLTYDQMMLRLNALKSAGANGCVVWLSSDAKDPATGGPVNLDTTQGWFKALIDFSNAN